jgi:phage N-6-adenine-methyltransferase
MDGDEYGTPLDFYQEINERFVFALDPCTTPDNPLNTPVFYTKEDDGLNTPWLVGPVFMNPPYSNVSPWVMRAQLVAKKGVLVVGLLRHDPSTKWWNNWVRDKAWVEPVPYRLKFRGANGAYNFPSAVVIWHGLFQEVGR